MDFNSPDHVFECVPPVLGISKAPKEEQVIIGLSIVKRPEVDLDHTAEIKARLDHTADKASEMVAEITLARIKDKVAFIRNLTVGGVEIKDFDTFYKEAPPELVQWVVKAVYSYYALSQAERKN